MKRLDLDDLLGDRYPDASFHDSELTSLSIDYAGSSVAMGFRIPIATKDNVYIYEQGSLFISGLHFISIEPPDTGEGTVHAAPLWITSDGPYPDEHVQCSVAPPESLPDSAYCHYFYSSDTNSFIVIAAKEFSFTWYTH